MNRKDRRFKGWLFGHFIKLFNLNLRISKMKKYILAALLLTTSNVVWAQKNNGNHPKGEIIYHVCQRSFYDSNGDLNGDLNGLRQKLDYLQELGVTSILLLPLYEADCYHNYFANDFQKIDPEFGTMEDYLALVKAVHKRGMKIYMDMETQYVTSQHLWWKDAVGNLNSTYSDFILFDDAKHQIPSTMVFGLRELKSFDGKVITATTVNLKSPKVLDYNIKLFSFFADPNHDGKFNDGVDGFRLDHAMDHLDGKPSLTNLFTEFWKPLIAEIKKVNPQLTIVAEQADWNDYGFEYFEKATVDRMFGFGLRKAILSFDKQQLIQNADIILNKTPKGKGQLIFIDNHDLDRFASLESNIEKQKAAAALMLLIGGIPSIYYGQEIGMRGKEYSFSGTDGNDIGRREAFDWYQSGDGKGMSFWYKNTGEWWTKANLKPNDGISLEEQKKDPNSLFQFYRKIIDIKQKDRALAIGAYENVQNDNNQVFTFFRKDANSKVLVSVNLSDKSQEFVFKEFKHSAQNLLDKAQALQQKNTLKPYQISIWKIR
jgi:glycosidase